MYVMLQKLLLLSKDHRFLNNLFYHKKKDIKLNLNLGFDIKLFFLQMLQINVLPYVF